MENVTPEERPKNAKIEEFYTTEYDELKYWWCFKKYAEKKTGWFLIK